MRNCEEHKLLSDNYLKTMAVKNYTRASLSELLSDFEIQLSQEKILMIVKASNDDI